MSSEHEAVDSSVSSDRAVLVVDDDEASRKLIIRWLSGSTFRCIEAASGEEALKAVAADPNAIEAIVLDVMMPGMDGFETLTHIQKVPEATLIPIVFLTASASEADIVRGVEAGAFDYLVKPFSGPVLVAKLRAMQTRTRAERELRYKLRYAEEHATTDALTGLLNRRSIDLRLPEAMADSVRYKEPLALIMFDLDLFKSINDEFGHPAGDRILSHVGQIARDVLRGGDAAFRYGGEEFLLLVRKCDALGALGVADRLRARLREAPLELAPGVWRSVTVSAGIAAMQVANGFRSDGLVARADAALYRAKRDGRNRTAVEETLEI